MKHRTRVLVAMSGGVDSSVAAARAVEAGHDVVGATLKLWGGESDSGCCSVADVEDARRVASQLGIAHYVFDWTESFATHVVEPYVDAYARGHTPNPCVECNRAIKFGRLLERARALDFDVLATGHHARVVRHDGHARLARAVDSAKDQSYVLAMLTERQLRRIELPIGDLTKAGVRVRARALGLRTADKPDSQDVCFITRGGRERFLASRIPAAPGPIVDGTGATVGRHEGVGRYTVGQRRGLGVCADARRFVVDIDAANATVTIGTRTDLLRDELAIRDLEFPGDPVEPGRQLLVQTRAHGLAVPAYLDGATVRFARPQPRVAPGQLVALYDGDVVVGSAVAG